MRSLFKWESKMFQELYYKAITHESYTEKYLPHFVFTPLALVSAGEVETGQIQDELKPFAKQQKKTCIQYLHAYFKQASFVTANHCIW